MSEPVCWPTKAASQTRNLKAAAIFKNAFPLKLFRSNKNVSILLLVPRLKLFSVFGFCVENASHPIVKFGLFGGVNVCPTLHTTTAKNFFLQFWTQKGPLEIFFVVQNEKNWTSANSERRFFSPKIRRLRRAAQGVLTCENVRFISMLSPVPLC